MTENTFFTLALKLIIFLTSTSKFARSSDAYHSITHYSESINQLVFSAPLYKPLLTLHNVDFYWKFIRRLNHEMRPLQSITYNFQIDMSKCMVAFIDWYHESMDGTPRRKVKVS